MILIRLSLENFRQFYGKHTIDFAGGRDGRNVTLIHGFNGAGKTTILNAFLWCLYGETTPDFGDALRLESERVLAETSTGSQVRVSVQLRYSVGDDEYIAEREVISTKIGVNEALRGEPSLSLFQIRSGEVSPVSGDEHVKQQRINRLLPRDLYPFFFFNGERVEALARAESSEKLERGIKVFLDVAIYERSMRHLRSDVAKALSDELKTLGTSELTTALEEESAIKLRIDQSERRIEVLDANILATREEIALLQERQAAVEVLVNLTNERATLDDREKKADSEISDVENDLVKDLSDDGYLAFAETAFSKTLLIVEQARERGELPAKIKPQFVTDLLDRQECICGRKLEPSANSTEVSKLERWRDQVGLAQFEEAISQTAGAIPGLRHRRDQLFDSIERLQGRRDKALTDRREIKRLRASVDERLGDRSLGEDIAELQRRLNFLRDKQLVDFSADRKTEALRLDGAKEELSHIARKISSLKVQSTKGARVKRQRESVDRIADVLEEIYVLQKQVVRTSLSDRLASVWNDAAIKPYRASLCEDFSLSLTKMVAGVEQPVHGTSTGEKQVLALSFVGSLVKKAQENLEASRESSHSATLPAGGEYPLVMDSPFGSLEDEYRSKVAVWIPKLAHQVVILVSKTQWRDEVERETRPKIGKEYILELHTQKQGAGRMIEIEGKTWPYVVETHDPVEQTVIREVL